MPAPGGPNDLDALLIPPPALPAKPGRVREYTLVAQDREIEVAQGVTYAAWTYNGTVPGPVLRATEGDIFRVNFNNHGTHPHTIHFHGIHPAGMDGVFETVAPGNSFTYEFEAHPYGMHLYHCHATPLKKHIEKGLYGALIIDPREPRPPAKELVMVMNGYDTDGDGENNFYTVNGLAFYYAKYPIRVKRGELVRIYLVNLTEFDLINSLHIHANFFRYYPTGSDRPLRVHGHGHALPGATRDSRARVPEPGPLHVPRTPVGVRRARLDGLLPGRGLMEARAATGSRPRLAALGACCRSSSSSAPSRSSRPARRLDRRPRRVEPTACGRARHPPSVVRAGPRSRSG